MNNKKLNAKSVIIMLLVINIVVVVINTCVGIADICMQTGKENHSTDSRTEEIDNLIVTEGDNSKSDDSKKVQKELTEVDESDSIRATEIDEVSSMQTEEELPQIIEDNGSMQISENDIIDDSVQEEEQEIHNREILNTEMPEYYTKNDASTWYQLATSENVSDEQLMRIIRECSRYYNCIEIGKKYVQNYEYVDKTILFIISHYSGTFEEEIIRCQSSIVYFELSAKSTNAEILYKIAYCVSYDDYDFLSDSEAIQIAEILSKNPYLTEDSANTMAYSKKEEVASIGILWLSEYYANS